MLLVAVGSAINMQAYLGIYLLLRHNSSFLVSRLKYKLGVRKNRDYLNVYLKIS